VIDIDHIATNLENVGNGIWASKRRSRVSYPEEAHARCLAIDDGSFWFSHRNRCLVELMRRFPPAGPVFDVGGGNGSASLAIRDAGFHIVLVEPGYQAVLNAQRRGVSPVIRSTLYDAGFKSHVLSAVALLEVLEHVEDDLHFLKTLRTLLVKGGKLYVTVPAYRFLWSVEDENAGHIRRYTSKSLLLKLEDSGFKADFMTYIFSALPAAIFCFRTVPSWFGLRQAGIHERRRKEHHPTGLKACFLNRLLEMEFSILRSGGTLPFGGSILLVARTC
jgi:SAM-dependent methyltransferase